MKLRLTLVKKEEGKSKYTFLEIAQQSSAGRDEILYIARVSDEEYHRLRPFVGYLYTEDSPGLLKNWINNNGGKNDNKTFTIDS